MTAEQLNYINSQLFANLQAYLADPQLVPGQKLEALMKVAGFMRELEKK